tara:strand:- start:10782 stop:11453 length:672 start_codon:yes stop_codon:yes gene_type:complete
MRKYGIFWGVCGPTAIEDFVDGAYICVITHPETKTNNIPYHTRMIELEDAGWEIRDCLKVLMPDSTYQIGLLRKPFKGTTYANVLKNGCGGINIEDCRVGDIVQNTADNARKATSHKSTIYQSGLKEEYEGEITTGRFPANLMISKDKSIVSQFPPIKTQGHWAKVTTKGFGKFGGGKATYDGVGTKSTAERTSEFFQKFDTYDDMFQYLLKLVCPKEEWHEL